MLRMYARGAFSELSDSKLLDNDGCVRPGYFTSGIKAPVDLPPQSRQLAIHTIQQEEQQSPRKANWLRLLDINAGHSLRMMTDNVGLGPASGLDMLMQADKNLMPVLVIPGFLCGQRSMQPFADSLQKVSEGLGTGPVHIPHFPKSGQSIDYYAEQLVELLESCPQQRFILVAHSMGGIIAAQAMQMLAEQQADKSIAACWHIATPWYGTSYAELTVTPNIRALTPQSELLGKLRRFLVENISCHHFVSAELDFLAQQDSALPFSWHGQNHHALGEDHASILFSSSVVQLLGKHFRELSASETNKDNRSIQSRR